MFKKIKLGFIKLENSVIGSSDHTLTDRQILLIQDIKNLSSKQSLVGSLFFIQIIFVPVNKCKYICVYMGKKYNLTMYIKLGDVMGLWFLVGRQNKNVKRLQPLFVFLSFFFFKLSSSVVFSKDEGSIERTDTY